jgi:tetratricopeptide (TPR) repeat protein
MLSPGNHPIIVLCVLLLVMTTGISVAQHPLILQYDDLNSGFSINYPEGAAVQVLSSDTTRETAFITQDRAVMMTVLIQPTNQSISQLLDAKRTSISFLPNNTILTDQKTTLSGKPAHEIRYAWEKNNTQVQALTITAIEEGKLYTIIYENLGQQFSSGLPLIQQMKDTFTYIPDTQNEIQERYYNSDYSFFPAMVYDPFGLPVYEQDGYSPWSYYPYTGMDGYTGYYLPPYNAGTIPDYSGYYYPDQSNLPYQTGGMQTSEIYPASNTQESAITPTQTPEIAVTTSVTLSPAPTQMSTPIQTPVTIPIQQQSDTAQMLIESGLDYLAQDKYDKAYTELQKALAINPDNSYGLYALASCLYFGYEGKEELALQKISRAVITYPASGMEINLASVYTLKADIEKFLKKYEDALESIESALSNSPDKKTEATLYYKKAIIQYVTNYPYEEVYKNASRAAQLNEDNSDYQEFLNQIITEMKDLEENPDSSSLPGEEQSSDPNQ